VTLDEFKGSLSDAAPPGVSGEALKALWYDARGDWNRAHEIAQDIDDKIGAWVHAYLHRKEGDEGNAAYWYHRAGRPVVRAQTLQAEWDHIVETLLG
jgi:hypothetical protein